MDINPRVLAAARAKVNEGRSHSIGEAVSEFALIGLEPEMTAPPVNNGLILLPSAPGHVITNEMVAEALLDD